MGAIALDRRIKEVQDQYQWQVGQWQVGQVPASDQGLNFVSAAGMIDWAVRRFLRTCMELRSSTVHRLMVAIAFGLPCPFLQSPSPFLLVDFACVTHHFE